MVEEREKEATQRVDEAEQAAASAAANGAAAVAAAAIREADADQRVAEAVSAVQKLQV